jgi:hypothetical protein
MEMSHNLTFKILANHKCLMKLSARNAENVMASGTRIGSLNKQRKTIYFPYATENLYATLVSSTISISCNVCVV